MAQNGMPRLTGGGPFSASFFKSPLRPILDPSWAHLGPILAPSWAQLGPILSLFGAPWAILASSWAQSGPILGLFGTPWAIFGPPWVHFRLTWALLGHLG